MYLSLFGKYFPQVSGALLHDIDEGWLRRPRPIQEVYQTMNGLPTLVIGVL